MRKSNWYSIYVCLKCESRLTRNEVLYSSGTCPYCGHSNGSTVCDYEKVVLRSVKHHKWWQILGRKITYEGQSEFSKRWLRKH